MPNAIALDVSAGTPCERCALFYALSRTENSRASFGRTARGACRTHGRGAWHHGPGAPGTTAEPAAPPASHAREPGRSPAKALSWLWQPAHSVKVDETSTSSLAACRGLQASRPMRIRFSRAGERAVHRRVLPGQPDELPDVVCLAHRVEPGVAAVRPDQPGEDAHCCRLVRTVACPVPPGQGKPVTVPPGRRQAGGTVAGQITDGRGTSRITPARHACASCGMRKARCWCPAGPGRDRVPPPVAGGTAGRAPDGIRGSYAAFPVAAAASGWRSRGSGGDWLHGRQVRMAWTYTAR
jgi:hypothetical protein